MSFNLFSETEPYTLTIEQAACIAKVSTATIRNWIKTGYLLQTDKGSVTKSSLEKFMKEVAGKEKLTARANKLLKNTQYSENISEKIKSIFESCSSESIGGEYESLLPESYRNREGIYYTPDRIVKELLKDIPTSADTTFLDPCCGSGNFIVEAIRKGVHPQNVYGFDTDENAVLITKMRIKQEFGFETENIKVADFLQEAYKLKNQGTYFDLIFTNPPWGKKIEKKAKEKYAVLYECGNSLDTTALFIGASLTILQPNGFLGFLVQEALFNIATFESIRKKILSKKILKCIDYGKVFDGILTKAQAIILQNQGYTLQDTIECHTQKDVFQRTLNSFLQNPKCILNFCTNEQEAQVIHHLYKVKHITLKNRAEWALGIVTGNNKKYCSQEQKKGYIPVFRGSDITKTKLKKPTCFIINDFSTFQQVAELDKYYAKEKIIYKFISSDLCFYYDTEQRLILNSANLLIPKDIPIHPKQLTALLNSEIINWLFKKLFATHKVLRSDLELLPIHFDYFSYYSDFCEENYLDYLQITKTQDGTYRIKS